MSVVKQNALLELLNVMLDNGVIQPSQAASYSQVLMVPKPNGKWRLCIHYRNLNKLITSFGWPLPHIRRMMDRIGSKKPKYFTVLDLTSGYHQVSLEEASRRHAAFITEFGVFEPTRISMG
ncbi:MAG: RNA-directed DNA polymerase [Richelia sp. SM2_1_7]|nr:RNA-directed DNA polymerase [Richelia sp. SM2_1_7]